MSTIPRKSIYSVFIIFLLISLYEHSIAQVNADSTTYYFDKDLNFCHPDKMTYIGFGKKEGGLFRLSMFTVGDAKLAMTGFYTDSTMKVREGEFNNYDATGRKISFEHYHLDTIYGYSVWITNNYLCHDSILFENGVDVMRISYGYTGGIKTNKVITERKTSVVDRTTYFEDGSIKSFAHWVKGTGDEATYFPNSSKIEAIISYINNEKTRERYFKEDGTEISQEAYKQALIDSKPSYPGGMGRLREYIRSSMIDVFRGQRYNMNLGRNSYNIVFWVDKNGDMYDLKVNQLSGNDPIYRGISMALATASKWNMKNMNVFGPISFSFAVTISYPDSDLQYTGSPRVKIQ